ncbi:hypothetical protein HMPREF1139_1086 [Campylobacter sp. FOBRC14]|nr:hypothetical protein HMPREF1139_1086 [Campylobacter sp. FOBRC14]
MHQKKTNIPAGIVKSSTTIDKIFNQNGKSNTKRNDKDVTNQQNQKR